MIKIVFTSDGRQAGMGAGWIVSGRMESVRISFKSSSLVGVRTSSSSSPARS